METAHHCLYCLGFAGLDFVGLGCLYFLDLGFDLVHDDDGEADVHGPSQAVFEMVAGVGGVAREEGVGEPAPRPRGHNMDDPEASPDYEIESPS